MSAVLRPYKPISADACLQSHVTCNIQIISSSSFNVGIVFSFLVILTPECSHLIAGWRCHWPRLRTNVAHSTPHWDVFSLTARISRIGIQATCSVCMCSHAVTLIPVRPAIILYEIRITLIGIFMPQPRREGAAVVSVRPSDPCLDLTRERKGLGSPKLAPGWKLSTRVTR